MNVKFFTSYSNEIFRVLVANNIKFEVIQKERISITSSHVPDRT